MRLNALVTNHPEHGQRHGEDTEDHGHAEQMHLGPEMHAARRGGHRADEMREELDTGAHWPHVVAQRHTHDRDEPEAHPKGEVGRQ